MVPLCWSTRSTRPRSQRHSARDLAEVTVPCRNLEAHSLERDRSIALTLTPLVSRRNASRSDSLEGLKRSTSGAAANRSTGKLPVSRWTARLYSISITPGSLVEQLERQLRHAVEHLHEPSSSVPQNDSCLPF